MKFFAKKHQPVELAPVPGISLRLPSGVAKSREFSHRGIWRKTACFATLNATILDYPSLFEDLPPVAFIWSEKSTPSPDRHSIYCEHGWVPRGAYQISSSGSNQRHPVSAMLGDPDFPLPSPTPENLAQLERTKIGVAPAKSPPDLCGTPFFLFALQLTTDLNLKRCNLEMECMASPNNERAGILLQQLSALIAECAPGARVIFLQHPAESLSFPAERFLCRGHAYVPKSRKLRCHDLLLSPNCRGLISINSNALNEATLFSKPIFQLGDFLMGRFPNRLFPYTLEEFLDDPDRCGESSESTRYLTTLMNHQFTLSQLADPFVLKNLILRELSRREPSA